MTATPATARPGETVAIEFPEPRMRGVAYTLEAWQESTWEVEYFLTSDGGRLGWRPDWWSVQDAEGRGWPDIGVTGPGPDHVLVPSTASPGTYRLCTANAPKKACALLTVAGPTESQTTSDCTRLVRLDGVVYRGVGHTDRAATSRVGTADEAECDDVWTDARGPVFSDDRDQITVWSFDGFSPKEVVGVRFDQDSFAVFIAESVPRDEADRIADELSSAR